MNVSKVKLRGRRHFVANASHRRLVEPALLSWCVEVLVGRSTAIAGCVGTGTERISVMVRLRNAVMAVALGTGVMGCGFSHRSTSPTTPSGTAMNATISHAGVWTGIFDDARNLHRPAGSGIGSTPSRRRMVLRILVPCHRPSNRPPTPPRGDNDQAGARPPAPVGRADQSRGDSGRSSLPRTARAGGGDELPVRSPIPETGRRSP